MKKEEKLSRRSAIKRIAATFAGAVVGAKALGKTQQGFQVAYMSNPPYNPYADSVYVDNRYINRGPSYNDYVSFYTSYSSHSPPPSPYGR